MVCLSECVLYCGGGGICPFQALKELGGEEEVDENNGIKENHSFDARMLTTSNEITYHLLDVAFLFKRHMKIKSMNDVESQSKELDEELSGVDMDKIINEYNGTKCAKSEEEEEGTE